jgi:hypothetical protein
MADVDIDATPISGQAVGLLTLSSDVGLGRLLWAQGWTGCMMCHLSWNSVISIQPPRDPVTAEPSMQRTFHGQHSAATGAVSRNGSLCAVSSVTLWCYF